MIPDLKLFKSIPGQLFQSAFFGLALIIALGSSCSGDRKTESTAGDPPETVAVSKSKIEADRIAATISKDVIDGFWIMNKFTGGVGKADSLADKSVRIKIENGIFLRKDKQRNLVKGTLIPLGESALNKKYGFLENSKAFLRYVKKNDGLIYFCCGEDGPGEEYIRR